MRVPELLLQKRDKRDARAEKNCLGLVALIRVLVFEVHVNACKCMRIMLFLDTKHKQKKQTASAHSRVNLSINATCTCHSAPARMLSPDALARLGDDLNRAEWARVRRVRVWSVYADSRARERRGAWGRGLHTWPRAACETHAGRRERRAWYQRLGPAQHARAWATWTAAADGGEALHALGLALHKRLLEARVYQAVAAALGLTLPEELVRVVWAHMQLDDAWVQADGAARGFLWVHARELEARTPPPPWRLGSKRDKVRAQWSRLVCEKLHLRRRGAGAVFWQRAALGDWHVLTPWRARVQPWRVQRRRP